MSGAPFKHIKHGHMMRRKFSKLVNKKSFESKRGLCEEGGAVQRGRVWGMFQLVWQGWLRHHWQGRDDTFHQDFFWRGGGSGHSGWDFDALLQKSISIWGRSGWTRRSLCQSRGAHLSHICQDYALNNQLKDSNVRRVFNRWGKWCLRWPIPDFDLQALVHP